jgi:hypothetical protein
MMPPSSEREEKPLPHTAFALVPTQSLDEREYSRLMIEIKTRNGQIGDLEAAITPLEHALEKFEWEYQARLGGLLAELRDLSSSTERMEHRTARIHARLVCDPGGILGDLFDREELTEIGQMFGIEIPESWFATDEPERERSDWDFASNNTSAEEEILRRLQQRQRQPLARDIDPEYRKLYRDLARRFHPDLATDDVERGTREEMMLRINAAWQDRDFATLKRIFQETEHLVPNWHRSLISTRLNWAKRERARLDERIAGLEHRLRTLRGSDTFPLWFNPELGNSVIARQALALRRDIAIQKERLDAAKEVFRQSLHAFAVASNLS